MESNTKNEIKRIDDDTIEMVTTITEKMSNQEFYDMWANMKIREKQNTTQIERNRIQVKEIERQNKIFQDRIEDMTKMAWDCEARLPSRPINKDNP